jgi:hypothetical protein
VPSNSIVQATPFNVYLTVPSFTSLTITSDLTPTTLVNGTLNLTSNNSIISTLTNITLPYTITGLTAYTSYTVNLAVVVNGTTINATSTKITNPVDFQLKLSSSSVPTVDNTGKYAVVNTGGVTAVQDGTKGWVLSFSGSNYLTFTGLTTNRSFTRTMWVYPIAVASSQGILNTWSCQGYYTGGKYFLLTVNSANNQVALDGNTAGGYFNPGAWLFVAWGYDSVTGVS